MPGPICSVPHLNRLNVLVKQDGNYLIVENHTAFPVFYDIEGHQVALEEEAFVWSVQVRNAVSGEDVQFEWGDLSSSFSFYLEKGEEYLVFAHLIERCGLTPRTQHGICFVEYNYGTLITVETDSHQCLNPATYGSLTLENSPAIIYNMLWDYPQKDQQSTMSSFSIILSETLVTEDVSIKKREDHHYDIEWEGVGIVSGYTVSRYDGEIVFTEDSVSDNAFKLEFKEDDLYVVAMKMEDQTIRYFNVYDFADTEKCYLDLVQNVLCDCVSCDDCPGANYQRIQAFINIYVLVRDIAYASEGVKGETISSDVIDHKYIDQIGLLISKLKVLTSECVCNER